MFFISKQNTYFRKANEKQELLPNDHLHYKIHKKSKFSFKYCSMLLEAGADIPHPTLNKARRFNEVCTSA